MKLRILAALAVLALPSLSSASPCWYKVLDSGVVKVHVKYFPVAFGDYLDCSPNEQKGFDCVSVFGGKASNQSLVLTVGGAYIYKGAICEPANSSDFPLDAPAAPAEPSQDSATSI